MDQEFKYFGWNEKDPTNKYVQPKPNTNPLPPEKDVGYPDEVNKAGVMVKGRWPSDTGMKEHIDMRGYGAATKGRKFLKD
jgi:hypothetical protein